jgi:formylglycine-generating enzyme required for sulfatase activity
MRTTKGILLVVLSGVVCLGCGRRNLQPGEVTTNSIGMKFVWIPPGTFQMGSNDGEDDEKPIHTVTISNAFYMGIYEVTQEQYQAVMGTNPSKFNGSNLPVEMVSWDDAVEFSKKLSQKEGKTYRLPTEAEWEYACRAGTTTKFSFGDDESQLGDYAWYKQNSGSKTHSVGTLKPNAWGLYDMHGNVWEWCLDFYAKDWYSKGPAENPLNESHGDKNSRVIRGGGWLYDSSILCRVSDRIGDHPYDRNVLSGFRIVLDSNSEEPQSNKDSGKVGISGVEPSSMDPVPSPQNKPSSHLLTTNVKPLPSSPQQGTEWENSIGMKLVWIPPGTFQKGSTDRDDQKPIHTVTITKGFYMGVYEVTQEQYQQVMGNNPSQFKGNDNLPIETVTWDEAVEFCKKLSELEKGKTYRLPTEAEWEYACRAGTTTKFSYGDDESQLGDYAWYKQNSGDKTHSVGEKKPNAWGLYDMHGNVWEWCHDWYGSYTSDSQSNPIGPTSGEYRVFRGGCWYSISSVCRVSYRGHFYPLFRHIFLGFRIVLDH